MNPPSETADPDPVRRRLVEALESGRTIEAIRFYRQETGCDLAEAKQAVAQIRQEAGITPPKAGCGAAAALLIAGICLLGSSFPGFSLS